MNPEKAKQVLRIFKRYFVGDNLGKIAAGLERCGVPSPTGWLKWRREAIDKPLTNEKYTGRVLLQKTVSTGASQTKNDSFMGQYLYTNNHEASISDKMFLAIQDEKQRRLKSQEYGFALRAQF